MKPDRKNTTCVLIDIRYHSSFNEFEEWYGENVSYQELEQSSYVEFKDMIFSEIDKNIKFRKYGRINNILTIKADMLKSEIDMFKKILEKNKIKLVYGWIVSNVTIITDGEKAIKEIIEEDDEEEIDFNNIYN